jgi:hypothetical protein
MFKILIGKYISTPSLTFDVLTSKWKRVMDSLGMYQCTRFDDCKVNDSRYIE